MIRGSCTQCRNLIRDRNVVSFQNGIGNEETMLEFTDKVIGGVVMTGFVTEGDRAIPIRSRSGYRRSLCVNGCSRDPGRVHGPD